MLKKNYRFQVNTPDIVHELIDGEAIIINMEKGHYFSLRSTGAEIWKGVVERESINEIVHKLSIQYNMGSKDIEQAVTNMVSQLQEEKLITPVMTEVRTKNTLSEDDQVTSDLQKTRFETPVLEKYTDMEALLMLDPIHEVDETGWPNS